MRTPLANLWATGTEHACEKMDDASRTRTILKICMHARVAGVVNLVLISFIFFAFLKWVLENEIWLAKTQKSILRLRESFLTSESKLQKISTSESTPKLQKDIGQFST